MGSPIQQVLPGGGGQKGKTVALLSLVPLLYAGLMAGFALKWPAVWFSLTGIATVLFILLAFYKKDQSQTFIAAFFVTISLSIAGLMEITALPWLHAVYFPVAVVASAFLGIGSLAVVLLSIPFLELKHLIEGPLGGELSLIGAAWAGSLISGLLIRKERQQTEKLNSTIRSMGEDAVESLDRGGLMSHDVSVRADADLDIEDILESVRISTDADSVSFFALKDGALVLRLSTEPGGIDLDDEGLIHLCYNRRQEVSFTSPDEGHKAGYGRKGMINSMAAVPLLDGRVPLGVIAADSSKEEQFAVTQIKVLELAARQLVRILKRQRVYAEMERSQYGLRVLHEEGISLTTSLNPSQIAGKLVEGAFRVAPLGVAVIVKARRGYRVVGLRGFAGIDTEKPFSLKNTLLDMAIKNREYIYISDLRNYKLPVVPFAPNSVRSAFMLPMLFENEPLGAVVLVSESIDPLTPYQVELLEVLGNQASTALANAMLHERIERMATTDGLTGLYNHRSFQEKLNGELRRYERFEEAFSLLLVDIDYFKKVNDTYGHPAGDAVLKSVAAIIKSAVREVDIPARYGGEEFAAILLGTGNDGARETAERLRITVQESTFKAEDKELKITVSIGLASYPADGSSKEELIDNADKALYHAKRNGRNQVVAWEDLKTI